ncbi:MAG: alpha/beta hydrolase [Candidatus Obscuribacterales bacterium]|nr:alpha/beta hydrolase [Candidatus Obscuribacterales bacterium]
MSKIEKTTQAFLDIVNSNTGPAIYELPPVEGRKIFESLQASTPVKKLDADLTDVSVDAGNYGSVSVKIVRPKGNNNKLPVLLYIHGAGWVFGSWNTHDRLVLELSNKADIAVAFVEYSLSPEAKSGDAIMQSCAVARYLKDNARELNIDATRMAVGGDSVGGNMSIALTIQSQLEACPRFVFQLLFYPVTNAKFDTDSYKQFGEKHFLTTEAMKWFWKQYEPNEENRMHMLLSPLQANTNDLKNMPPALVITAECDVLRDEGEAYAHKLMEAGVSVQAIRCLGTIHDFVMLNAITETPAARLAIEVAAAKLREHLHQAFASANV